MQLIDELRGEHELIEQVLGSLRTYVAQRLRGEAAAGDGQKFMSFFRLYAGHFHHAREEDTLFVALRKEAEMPERGPLAVLLDDHARLAGMLNELEPLLQSPLQAAPERARIEELATAYAHSLWHHIDAENSVLFPESEGRLKRCGLTELPSRPATPEELEAKGQGESLVARYQPASDFDGFRGDGCVACPAYGKDCQGLEREWWNEWEWEELDDHLPNG